jgi:hypothetical protein
MIGISMDKRILGAQETTDGYTTEFLSTLEYNYLKGKYQPVPYDDDPEVDSDTDVDVDPQRTMNDLQRDQLREIACIAFHIIHIVAVGLMSNDVTVNPWQHITMGSDYDGLIEPLALADYCTDLDANGIEGDLLTLMPCVESSYLHYHPYVTKTILPRTAAGGIDTTDLQNKIRAIMYDNGAAFLKLWYTDSL